MDFDERFPYRFLKEELATPKIILIGCDLHDSTMLLKIAVGREDVRTRSGKDTTASRRAMIGDLKKRAVSANSARIVFADKASGQGFGLCDELTDAGVECHVLAPAKIARSQRQASQKSHRDREFPGKPSRLMLLAAATSA